MQARNPHSDNYDVKYHVHFLFESDPNTMRPRADDVVVNSNESSLAKIGERLALLHNQPFGSIYIASCYIKGYV